MGLLDSGPLSSPDAQIALAAGLLSGTGNFGANLSKGLLGAQSAAQQERANRQNDLQQLMGMYGLLKQQEGLRMLQAKRSGVPYQPNPMLGQMESRLNQLLGNPNLSSQGPTGSALPPTSSPNMSPGTTSPLPIAQGQPGFAAPSSSVVANPDYQPPQVRAPSQSAPPSPPMPASADPFGGPAFGIEPEEFAAMDPQGSLKGYQEALLKQLQPITTKYGVYFVDPRNPQRVVLGGGMIPKDAMPVTVGPNGEQSIAPLPGQLKTAAQNAAAQSFGKEAGEFPFRVQTVKLADGREVPQFVSSSVGNPNVGGLPFLSSLFGNQGMPSASPQPIPQPAPQGLPQSAPAPSTPAPKVAQVTVTQPSRQAQAQPDPWATMPPRPIAQGIGQSTYDSKLDNLRAETASDLFKKYGAAATVAQDRKALNNQALDLVDRADTGYGAALMGDIKNALISRFGVPAEDFTDKLGKGDPNATAALNKDLMQAAVAKAKASFGAKMSTNEVNNMLKRGAPNGDMMKGAIKFLLTMDNAKADYETRQANDLGRYITKNGDPLQFEGWYSTAFPLHEVLDSMTLAPNVGNTTLPATGWKVQRVQ